jgi:hypothetical protein
MDPWYKGFNGVIEEEVSECGAIHNPCLCLMSRRERLAEDEQVPGVRAHHQDQRHDARHNGIAAQEVDPGLQGGTEMFPCNKLYMFRIALVVPNTAAPLQ